MKKSWVKKHGGLAGPVKEDQRHVNRALGGGREAPFTCLAPEPLRKVGGWTGRLLGGFVPGTSTSTVLRTEDDGGE